MKQEDAKKLKPGDLVVTIGLKDPILCVVETVSEYGSVNIHDIYNYGHFFRTYEEIFLPLKDCDSIAVMYWKQNWEQLGQMYDEYRENSELWYEDEKPFGVKILAELSPEFCGGNSRYALLYRCMEPYEHYTEDGEEIPNSAINKFLVLQK